MPAKLESTVITQFESGHVATCHSAELDYFSKLVATCSSDRLVKIHRVEVCVDATMDVSICGVCLGGGRGVWEDGGRGRDVVSAQRTNFA